jgi:diadenosine tetraphosphatase ApaH/serine/threonine PP2A family protein phosphatase
VQVTIPDFCLVAAVAPRHGETITRVLKHVGFGEPVIGGSPGWLEVVSAKLQRREPVSVAANAISTQQDLMGLVRIAKHHNARAIGFAGVHTGARAGYDAFRMLEGAGFRPVYLVPDDSRIEISHKPLAVDLRREFGPFDIIGDVHGCGDELESLLDRLGYQVAFSGTGEQRRVSVTAPQGRRAIFVGDFVDRGPRSPDVMRIVMTMCAGGLALAVPGNHDAKFHRWLTGHNVRLNHGLDRTVEQFLAESVSFRETVAKFLAGLPNHLWLEGGRLAVAHAGIHEDMIGRDTGAVREFCLYGDTDGDKDEAGLAIRYHWAAEYRGATTIVYGHTPLHTVEWFNNTLCVDTGCCFGGELTALRWPEREIVSVPALREYAQRGRAFGHPPQRPR